MPLLVGGAEQRQTATESTVGTRAEHIFSNLTRSIHMPPCCAVLCCQDAGGTDRPLPPALLPLLTYLCPNELELQALTGSSPTGTHEEVGGVTRRCFCCMDCLRQHEPNSAAAPPYLHTWPAPLFENHEGSAACQHTGCGPTPAYTNHKQEQLLLTTCCCCRLQVVAAARKLVDAGVSSVLVTLSGRGAVLVQAGGAVTSQPALPVPGDTVVDGTAAGATAATVHRATAVAVAGPGLSHSAGVGDVRQLFPAA